LAAWNTFRQTVKNDSEFPASFPPLTRSKGNPGLAAAPQRCASGWGATACYAV